jgi:hypothetical protein
MDVDKAVRRELNRRQGGVIGLERNFYDKTVGNTSIGTTMTLINPNSNAETLNSVPQGDGASQRTADKITMKSIQVKGTVTRLADTDLADAPQGMIAEVFLILDLYSNGTAPTATDVLTGPAGKSMQVVPNAARFIVLGRKSVVFDSPSMGTDGTNTQTTGGQIRKFKMFVKLNHVCRYIATADAVTSQLDRALSIVAVSSLASAPNELLLSYRSRLRFMG